jgi:hypothetical protein
MALIVILDDIAALELDNEYFYHYLSYLTRWEDLSF